MGELLNTTDLALSDVVANCAMNRDRGLASYGRELNLDVRAFLLDRLAANGRVRWLDLCCGAGRALSEAAVLLPAGAELTGVDLVGYFAPAPASVRLEVGSLADWAPPGVFDLITCVHGLHYVGDKLDALARASSWLAEDGVLRASLDLAGVSAPRRALASALRAGGFGYDGRRRLVSRTGPGEPRFPFTYLGADDRVGPNYTGQPAVLSHYR